MRRAHELREQVAEAPARTRKSESSGGSDDGGTSAKSSECGPPQPRSLLRKRDGGNDARVRSPRGTRSTRFRQRVTAIRYGDDVRRPRSARATETGTQNEPEAEEEEENGSASNSDDDDDDGEVGTHDLSDQDWELYYDWRKDAAGRHETVFSETASVDTGRLHSTHRPVRLLAAAMSDDDDDDDGDEKVFRHRAEGGDAGRLRQPRQHSSSATPTQLPAQRVHSRPVVLSNVPPLATEGDVTDMFVAHRLAAPVKVAIPWDSGADSNTGTAYCYFATKADANGAVEARRFLLQGKKVYAQHGAKTNDSVAHDPIALSSAVLAVSSKSIHRHWFE